MRKAWSSTCVRCVEQLPCSGTRRRFLREVRKNAGPPGGGGETPCAQVTRTLSRAAPRRSCSNRGRSERDRRRTPLSLCGVERGRIVRDPRSEYRNQGVHETANRSRPKRVKIAIRNFRRRLLILRNHACWRQHFHGARSSAVQRAGRRISDAFRKILLSAESVFSCNDSVSCPILPSDLRRL